VTVRWSPDGSLLATACEDGTVQIWPDPRPIDELLDAYDRLHTVPVLSEEQRRRASLPPLPEDEDYNHYERGRYRLE
jgi:hypothetical protein